MLGQASDQLEVDVRGRAGGGAHRDVPGGASNRDVSDQQVAQDQVVGDRLRIRRALGREERQQQAPGARGVLGAQHSEGRREPRPPRAGCAAPIEPAPSPRRPQVARPASARAAGPAPRSGDRAGPVRRGAIERARPAGGSAHAPPAGGPAHAPPAGGPAHAPPAGGSAQVPPAEGAGTSPRAARTGLRDAAGAGPPGRARSLRRHDPSAAVAPRSRPEPRRAPARAPRSARYPHRRGWRGCPRSPPPGGGRSCPRGARGAVATRPGWV